MFIYFLLFAFFVFYSFLILKGTMLFVLDLIAGFVVLIIFGYSFLDDYGNFAAAIFLFNIVFYFLQFLSSLFIYFDENNEKRTYWIFTILAFIFLVLAQRMTLNMDDAFKVMYIPVSLAFFPFYFVRFYKKYSREDN